MESRFDGRGNLHFPKPPGVWRRFTCILLGYRTLSHEHEQAWRERNQAASS